VITKEQDAFGAAAMAYFKGDKEARIQLDSDIPGAEPVLEKMSEYFQEYEDFNFEYKEALKYARGRVLDVGCGAGRFLLYIFSSVD
jgi:SAM-dependent methyltransferase